ncbi:MAG: VCBS repeat-containing protein, partial [Bacteroidota bacterium]
MAVLSRFFAVGALMLAACQPVAQEYAWQEADGYRFAPLDVRGSGDGFTPRLKTGIAFANDVTDEAVVGNRHLLHGSGVALGDVDGDGRTDVYLASLQGDNKLYRNLGGWRFEDITEQAGVAAPDRYGTGATFADLDGDGDQDLLVTALGGPNAAYVNDGTGVFTEATTERGLTSSLGSTTQALADVDGDGDLDLYVANYKRVALRDSLPPDQVAWDRVIKQLGDTDYYVTPEFRDHYALEIIGTKLLRLETGEPDAFYLNDGTGRFDKISLASEHFLDAGGQPLEKAPRDWGLVVRLQDVNGDGHPDLYVCNDFESPDYFFLNQGDGTFRQQPTLTLRKTSNSTMAVAFSDIDRNGTTDFFTADMLSRDYQRRQVQMGTRAPIPAAIGAIDNRPQEMQNMLFLGRGDGTFAEVAYMADVAASEWTWASLFMDVDLDGFEDLLVTNGHAFDVQNADAKELESMRQARVRTYQEFRELLYLYPPLELQNVAFRNNGDGT